MKKSFKRVLCMGLSVAMILGSFTACGKKDSGSSNSSTGNAAVDASMADPTHYFKAEYLSDLPDTLNSNVYSGQFVGDSFYYESWDDDYRFLSICSYNLVTGESKVVKTIANGSTDPYKESENVYSYCIGKDGTIYAVIGSTRIKTENFDFDPATKTREDVTAYMAENWGYTDEDIDNELGEESYYIKNYTDENGTVRYDWIYVSMVGYDYGYESKYYIKVYDADGNEKSSTEIEQPQGEDGMELSLGVNSIVLDKDENLVCNVNIWGWGATSDSYFDEYRIMVFDKNGNKTADNKIENYLDRMYADNEGVIHTTQYGDNGQEMVTVDVATGTFGDGVTIGETYFSTCFFNEDNNMVAPSGTGLYEINMKTGEKTKYMNLIGCGVSPSSLQTVGILSNGTLAAFINYYSELEQKSVSELVKFKEITKEEWGNKKTLLLACDYLDSSIEQLVLEANRKATDYVIDVVEYVSSGEEEDYYEARNQYYAALASNKDIDIVVFSYNGYSSLQNFAKKGLLTDLTPLMEANGSIKKSDIFDSIVNICSMNDKLVALPTGFGISTLVANPQVVGNGESWTVKEAMDLLNSMPEGTKFTQYATRDGMLEDLIDLNYRSFIDIEKGKCDLDNEEFKDVLRFSALFPKEYDYDDDSYADPYEELGAGRTICDTCYLSDYSVLQVYERIFGTPGNYIGYPTSEGNGALMNMDGAIGITTNADDPQACFDLIAPLYKLRTYEDGTNMYSLPIRKDSFKNMTEKWKTKETYDTWYLNETLGELEMQPPTQEQIDIIEKNINNAIGVQGALPTEIKNIIMEEASAFYSGDKTVDEVTPLIQSRVSIYLSETN